MNSDSERRPEHLSRAPARGGSARAPEREAPARAEPAPPGWTRLATRVSAPPPPPPADGLPTGGGLPLDPATRAYFELRFGQDFGGVRVHTGASASQAARSVSALAYAVGPHLVFRDGSFDPGSRAGRKLLAHELAHVVQQGAPTAGSAAAVAPADHPAEREADRAAEHALSGAAGLPSLTPLPAGTGPLLQRQTVDVDDEDALREASPPGPGPETQPLVLAELGFEPVVDEADPATFRTPPGTTRAGIAAQLYGDPNHVGGFDIVGENQVRMRSFQGVAAEVAAPMRAEFEKRLSSDVAKVIGILSERLILGGDERTLLAITVWWSNRSELSDAQGRSYFDRYLDALDGRKLTMERPIISDITHTALEWLLIEAEEKASAIYPLIARRSTRGAMRAQDTRVFGPMTRGTVVGSYTYRTKRAALAIGEWDHHIGEIRVRDRLVDESSAARAEIALRNSPIAAPRLMIPGGNGRFYGYTVDFPRLEEGYAEPGDHWYTNQPPEHIDDWWWQYPGTIVIHGGEFQPEFGAGGEAEKAQRADILARALAGSADEQRGLDFDVLSLATLDERMTLIDGALARRETADVSLIARVLYATSATDFPTLERRLSVGGDMKRLIDGPFPSGSLAIIGRVFTVKSVESMQVPGEDLQSLPEFEVGFDDDGFYHFAWRVSSTAASRTLDEAAFRTGDQVSLGHERALPGEAAGPITRAVVTLEPYLFKVSNMAANFVRGMRGTLMTRTGPPVGPMLPTHLVRVTLLGATPQTRIVTALEAAGMLALPSEEIRNRMISAHLRGGMWLFAGMGLVRAFGPALAEGLLAGGGARAVAAGVAEAAGAEAGSAALLNTAVLGGMEVIDQNRDAFSRTEAGRAFLEIFDATMLIWVSKDVGRLIVSGLIPRLAKYMEFVVTLPGEIRRAMLPLRDEVEAMRRAIARYASPAEAAEAATPGGMMMAATGAGGARPGFFATLRVARAEVASERLLERVAGSASAPVAKRVLDRLESLVQRSEAAAGKATDAEARAAATKAGDSAAAARLAIAQRANQLQPAARDAFLRTVEAIVNSRPASLASLTDLLTAAAASRRPNVFLAEVQRLVGRKGISDEALAVLGRKMRGGVLEMSDLAWLNRTSLADETIDFLGRDDRTSWDLLRRAVEDPGGRNVMRSFRTAARGAGAEMVAAGEAEKLGTRVRRQVPMGTSELDFEITSGRRRFGFEVKGWTPDTWEEALDAAILRLNKKGLTEAQRKVVEKIDRMLKQLADAKAATGSMPYLGVTDALSEARLKQLRRILQAEGLGGTTIVPLSEDAIRKAAHVTIGQALGVPLP